MVEGYDTEGRNVLINRAEVVEVYANITPGDSVNWGDWCNVVTSRGTVHRFTSEQAKKVYNALRQAD
jgi:hypothetical protein